MHPAAERVLFDRVLLLATLTAGPLAAATTADLARVAGTCRFFAAVVRGEDAALWRPVWLRECASVREHAAAVALPAGVGYRASLRQRWRSRQPPPRPPRVFGVEDYTLTVDCAWRGEPLYAAQFPLTGFSGDAFYEYDVHHRVASQAVSSVEPSCAAAFVRAEFREGWTLGESPFPEAGTAAFDALSASAYVLRSDGAVACLGAGVSSTKGVILDDDASGLYIGKYDEEDDAGPFVQFDFQPHCEMEITCLTEDSIYEAAVSARFLLLFAPQLTTSDNNEPRDEDDGEQSHYEATFARGEVQLVGDKACIFYNGLQGPEENMLKAMRTLRFVHA
jgi:hypothetical protein